MSDLGLIIMFGRKRCNGEMDGTVVPKDQSVMIQLKGRLGSPRVIRVL